MLYTTAGKEFTRSQLVRIMANQDGGAHVDPEIDVDYAGLLTESFGLEVALGDVVDVPDAGWQQATGDIAAQAMRQVSEEIVYSLRKQWPDLAPPETSPRATRALWALTHSPGIPVVIGYRA